MKTLFTALLLSLSLLCKAQRKLVHLEANSYYYTDSTFNNQVPFVNQDTITAFKLFADNNWTAYYKGKIVYVPFFESPELKMAMNKMLKQAYTDEEKRNTRNYTAQYGLKYGRLIAESKIAIGMTKNMARASWGAPTKVNRTATSRVMYEQWVYDDNTYLYFENGILKSWQD